VIKSRHELAQILCAGSVFRFRGMRDFEIGELIRGLSIDMEDRPRPFSIEVMSIEVMIDNEKVFPSYSGSVHKRPAYAAGPDKTADTHSTAIQYRSQIASLERPIGYFVLNSPDWYREIGFPILTALLPRRAFERSRWRGGCCSCGGYRR
jgi:hypothetical protein